MNILHVMPHMGPGPGKAVSSLVCAARNISPNEHEILLVDRPANLTYINKCSENGVFVDYTNESGIPKRLERADIVQLEWWHHPLMLNFLSRYSDVPMRLVVWSHISGCYYPYLSPRLIEAVNKFVFTTEYSYENKLWSLEETERIKSKTAVIPGCGNVDNVKDIKKQGHKGFNIGYIGTLDFYKLNPDFVKYCAAVDVPGVRFIMVGDDGIKSEILKQAEYHGIAHKFEFTGFVSDIKEQLAGFDAAGYLLNENHYGTTDNALLELMAAGIPVVILNQCGERFVVKNGVSGLAVNNAEEYGRAIRFLYENPDRAANMGAEARRSVLENYAPERNVLLFDCIYDIIYKDDKKPFAFETVFGSEPNNWLYNGLGVLSPLFDNGDFANMPPILRGSSKSSIKHFADCFPGDDVIQRWNTAREF